MLRLSIVILALACTGCGNRRSAAHRAATATESGRSEAFAPDTAQSIAFGERIHDFGSVQEKDGVISHRFRFTNPNDRPVVVTQAVTSCQCIRAEFSHEPVLPGGEGFVTVSYDPTNRPGTFSKEIRILFDAGKAMSRIWIRGEVIPYLHPVEEDHPYDLGQGLRSNLKVLLLGGIVPGEVRSILFRYGNASEKTMHLRFRVEGATREALTLPDTAILAPEDRREIHISYRMPEGLLGAQRLHIIPEVDGKALSPLELTAVALPPRTTATALSPAMECPQRNFLLERSANPQPIGISIGNSGGSPLRILHVDLPQGVETALRAGIEIAPGETRNFGAAITADKAYHDRIYIVTNDPVRSYATINLNTKSEDAN